MATKTAKKTNTQVKEVKDQIAEVTEQISEVKDQIAEATSTGFDTFKDTVIDGSVKLMGKNQELVFTTLEGVKSQVTMGTDRFKQLFSLN